jgi:hypothetical protein
VGKINNHFRQSCIQFGMGLLLWLVTSRIREAPPFFVFDNAIGDVPGFVLSIRSSISQRRTRPVIAIDRLGKVDGLRIIRCYPAWTG